MEASVVDELANRRAEGDDDLGAKTADDGQPGDPPAIDPEPDSPPAQLALFEGHRVSKMLLTFGGSIEVTDPDMVKQLKLGKEINLSIVGTIEQRNHGRTKDGLKSVSVLKPVSVELV